MLTPEQLLLSKEEKIAIKRELSLQRKERFLNSSSYELKETKEEFRESIKKISADIDSVFYGYKKVSPFFYIH